MASEYRYHRSVGGLIMLVTGVIAAIFVLHIILVLVDANSANALATFLSNASDDFGLWFKDLFTPSDYKIRTLVNYGLAAAFYLVVGRLVATVLNRAV